MPSKAIIIGAGPAGLTVAHELATRTGVRPLVLEQSHHVGGISRTVEHAGNRIDIGGHRFFSKSDRVMGWWLARMPLQQLLPGDVHLAYHNRRRALSTDGSGPDPAQTDRVMLLRPRKSRIFHAGQFFAYPLSLDLPTLQQLGARRSLRIGLSYGRARLQPRPEDNLEDFLINRFGHQLYRTFFAEYTAKVWGRPCDQISAEWGAQRIKGLSLRRALVDGAARRVGLRPRRTETTLMEQFLYPKLGPGQMWQTVAGEVEASGGEVRLGWKVVGLQTQGKRVVAVDARAPDGSHHRLPADLVYSTMPVPGLVRGVAAHADVPADVRAVAEGLEYRDFVTVGLLLDELAVHESDGARLRDTWIYIQEPGVAVGRLQIFNNWSPWMVADPAQTWIGMEYFSSRGDALWTQSDASLAELARTELLGLGLARPGAIQDAVVVRMPKAYPGYFGTHDRFGVVRTWLDGFDNLVTLGRNGMHRYNNQDHSMLTAMVAVDNLLAGRRDRGNLWAVNTEQDYHEQDGRPGDQR